MPDLERQFIDPEDEVESAMQSATGDDDPNDDEPPPKPGEE